MLPLVWQLEQVRLCTPLTGNGWWKVEGVHADVVWQVVQAWARFRAVWLAARW